MVIERARPHRDIIEDLESQGRILEAVFLAWGIIEVYSSDSLFKIFLKTSKNYPNWDWINNMRVSTKIRLLHQLGHLSNPELANLNSFKKKRDELAHKHGIFFPNYSEEEKADLIEKAIRATDTIYSLSDRLNQKE